MTTSSPKKEIILNYSINDIKTAIEALASNPNLGCSILDKNNLFNTYSISIVKGFSTALMAVTLNPNGDKTEGLFEIYNTVGGIAKPATLSHLQDYFLQLLSSALTGNLEQVEKIRMQERKKGNNNLSIILIAIIIITIICIAGYVYNIKNHY